MVGELSIGQVARMAGVQPSTLRFYESIGLLPEARRVNGRRRYSPETLQLLGLIGLAKQAGFSIAEIQTLLHGFEPHTPPAARWRRLASQKLDELAQQLERLQRMQSILEQALLCGCLRLEDCTLELERV